MAGQQHPWSARAYRPGSMQERPDAPEQLAALARWLLERWNDVLRQVRLDARDELAFAHLGHDDFADDGKDKEP
jgi:hypothetical protein